jgi:parallel beta-helix repeat protein
MKKILKNRKINSVILTLFFIISLFYSINISSAEQFNEENIIYVDDDNTMGPWDGSINYPFQTINDALTVSIETSSIFIFSGTYHENLFVNKYVNIKGENKDETIISGSITFFEINKAILSNLTITNENENQETSGITINNSKNTIITQMIISNHHTGVLISKQSEWNLIKENTIKNNQIGLDVCSSDNNLIYGNIIEENLITNVILYHSTDNHITQNIIQNAEHNLQFHTSKDILIHNYWGNEKRFQIFTGYHTIKGINLVIPWIKILFNPLSTSSQQKINPISIMITNLGTMQIELFTEELPITSQNFIDLANINFFDGLVFHRVIDDFVIQGGGFDVNGIRKDSPFGTIPLETHPDITHVDGAISMARTSDPDSATSQFFICDGAQHGLDENYAAFGTLLVGFNTLDSISQVETTRKHFMEDWPVEEVIIKDVLIL